MEDYWQDIENLLVKHRARQALRNLMAAGPLATPALRRGLYHSDPVVRVGCCVVLDHFLDEEAIPDLIANLEYENPEVRSWALHALACDMCKEGVCRPGEDESIPLAMRMLAEDPSSTVRWQALRLLFPAVHRRQDVLEAIGRARDFDPSRTVRRYAALRAPGGVMFLRTSPERPRLMKSNARAHLSVR